MWKNLRAGQRYRRKKKEGKSGDSGNEYETDLRDWEYAECMAFLTPTPVRTPRSTAEFGFATTTTSAASIATSSASNATSAALNTPSAASTSPAVSNYSYVCLLNIEINFFIRYTDAEYLLLFSGFEEA